MENTFMTCTCGLNTFIYAMPMAMAQYMQYMQSYAYIMQYSGPNGFVFFFGPRFWWPNVWSSEDLRSRAWRRFFVHFVPNTFVNETKFVNIQTLQTLQMSLQTFHLNSSLTIGNFWRLISYRFCAEIFLFPWQLSNWCWDPSNQRNSSSFYSFYPKLSWTSSYLERLELHRYPSLVTRDSQEQLEVESQEL